MALNQQQLTGAQDWIQNLWTSTGRSPLQFTGDLDPSNPANKDFITRLLGSAQGFGYNYDDLAQILNKNGTWNGGMVESWANQNAPQNRVNQYSTQFATDMGYTTPQQNLQQAHIQGDRGVMGWQGGAQGGYTQGQFRPQSVIDTVGRGGSGYNASVHGPGIGGQGRGAAGASGAMPQATQQTWGGRYPTQSQPATQPRMLGSMNGGGGGRGGIPNLHQTLRNR
jgi:hypothetical protein